MGDPKDGSLEKPYLPQEVIDPQKPIKLFELMPPKKEIPEEFFRDSTWSDLADKLSFNRRPGLCYVPKKNTEPKISLGKALNHITHLRKATGFNHRYSRASAGYLLSLWVDAIIDKKDSIGGEVTCLATGRLLNLDHKGDPLDVS